MSNPISQQLLDDVSEQCRLLIEDVGDTNRQEFSENRVLQRAVERYLTIIGEIGTQIRLEDPELFDSLGDLQYSVGLRNRLAHGYGNVINEEIIWETIQVSIPKLMAEIRNQTHRGN